MNRHEFRYSVEMSGQLQGASGTYRCATNNIIDAEVCSVQNNGGSFNFVSGTWGFIPSSANAGVRVDDGQHMYFGWWARQQRSDDTWSFETFHGGNVKPD